MQQVTNNYRPREFWLSENLNYAVPHFRLEKVARIVNKIAGGRPCELLDVGCGPATLRHLLNRNTDYFGIDIAIHDPAPNLLQADFAAAPIAFRGKQFDIVVAQGVFEYIGAVQLQKFSEIEGLLRGQHSKFVVSYVNFDHVHSRVYPAYNNIQPFQDFKASLERFFHIDRCFPTSHHWHHREPKRPFMKTIQMDANVTIPIFSRLFAIEYLFICSSRSCRPV